MTEIGEEGLAADVIDDLPPSKRVKAVTAIHQFGTRAQKRAIAGGKVTGSKIRQGLRWTGRQFTQPYTTTKIIFAGMALGLAVGGMFIFAYAIAIWAVATWGSLWITFAMAFLGSVAWHLGIVSPTAYCVEKYTNNAQTYALSETIADFGKLDLSGFLPPTLRS